MPPPPPRPLRVLISGGGIAGPALAFWLSRLPASLKCAITIVERHPSLRNSGQQIDLRGQGIEAMRRMGIEAAVRKHLVSEPGVAFLNQRGVRQAFLGGNTSGKGAQTFSTGWEIMRGDLCDVLWEVTRGLEGVRYVFGCEVEGFEQTAKGAVNVRFSGGKAEEEFDLLVGADGVGSRIRRRMFTDGRGDKLDPIGMSMAYFTIPPAEGDEDEAVWCHIPGRRFVMTRRDRPDCLRVYLSIGGDHPELNKIHRRGTVEEQKKAWAKIYGPDMNETWQMPRFLDGMMNSPLADDFYAQELAQVKIDNWSNGRVVLLGDSAFCATPMSGMGTSMALAGAYVLAGEIGRACKKSTEEGNDHRDGLPSALAAYEAKMRPFVKDVQSSAMKTMVKVFLPNTAWQISLFHWGWWLFIALRFDKLGSMFMSDDTGGWKLPDYSDVLEDTS